MFVLQVIYEDDEILVCYKPAGVATQTKRIGQQDMESLIRNYRARKKEQPYVGIVHRLDQPVEGVMVFGKNPTATAFLNKQVQERSIGKNYYAATLKVGRRFIPKKDTLTDYMTFDSRSNVGEILHDDLSHLDKMSRQNVKKAVLDYKIIGEDELKLLFDINLHTGRHHQIRLQLSNIGCPIIGDTKYGNVVDEDVNEVVNVKKCGLALCSYRISFVHPKNKEEMEFKIEPQNIEIQKLLQVVIDK